MSSPWPIVCELMFRRRQNGLLGVETPSFNSFLSSHAMCERKKACACVCLCLCVLAQKSVQVLKLWTRSISWKSALLSPTPPPHPLSNPVHLPRLYFLICFFHYFLFPTSSSCQSVLLSVVPHPSLSFSIPVISVAFLSSVDPSRSHLSVQNPVSTSPSDVDHLFMELFSFCRCSSICPLSGDIQQHHSQLLSFHLCAFQTPSTQFNSAWFIKCLLQSQLSSGALPVLTWTSTRQVLWFRPCLRTAPPSLLHRSCWTYISEWSQVCVFESCFVFLRDLFFTAETGARQTFLFLSSVYETFIAFNLFFFFFCASIGPKTELSGRK